MTNNLNTANYYMQQALKQAEKAFEADEIPVGAVVVCKNEIIARGHNQTELLKDVTAHAEMLVTTIAADYLGGKFLNNCDLYITLEPCTMCAGALYWARYKSITFGASDEKRGFQRLQENILHPSTEIKPKILEAECASILKRFFAKKRL